MESFYNVTDSQGRKDLLENAVSHLLAPESTPEGSVSGTVRLFDETSHEGVTGRIDCDALVHRSAQAGYLDDGGCRRENDEDPH